MSSDQDVRTISGEELLQTHAAITGSLAGTVVSFEPGAVIMVPAVADNGEGLSLNYFRVVRKDSTKQGFVVELKFAGVHGVIQTLSMKARERVRVAKELGDQTKGREIVCPECDAEKLDCEMCRGGGIVPLCPEDGKVMMPANAGSTAWVCACGATRSFSVDSDGREKP